LKFFDRKTELKVLRETFEACCEGKMNFAVIYGRRGVGKTRLVHEAFSLSGVRFLYIFVGRKSLDIQLGKFLDRLSECLGRRVPRVRSFEDFLLLLRDISKKDAIIVVFDEFQNFKDVDESIFSIMQEFVDDMKFRENVKLFIIVIGSLVGMMHNIFEAKEAPLYGRATLKIHLRPFRYWQIRNMLMSYDRFNEEEIVEIYSMLGGMPRYYDTIDRLGLKIRKETIIDYFTNKSYAGWREVRDELIEEFKDAHPTYFSILEAISMGKNDSGEIINYTGIPSKSIHKYLNELINHFEILKKALPYGAKPRARGAKYFIIDPFYRFWFRYIFPNIDLIEIEHTKPLKKHIMDDLPNHIGPIFEEIARETILAASGSEVDGIKIPKINKIGPWWDNKGNEIDIVAGWGQKVVLIGEVSWSKKQYNVNDINELENKIRQMGAKNVSIIIISRGGTTRGARSYIEEKGGYILGIDDLAKIWDQLTQTNKNI